MIVYSYRISIHAFTSSQVFLIGVATWVWGVGGKGGWSPLVILVHALVKDQDTHDNIAVNYCNIAHRVVKK